MARLDLWPVVEQQARSWCSRSNSGFPASAEPRAGPGQPLFRGWHRSPRWGNTACVTVGTAGCEADTLREESRRTFHRANKNPVISRIVQTLLIKPGLKRAFGGIYVYVDPATLELRKSKPYPIIFCMTHS